MPAPKWLAHFNKQVTNRFTLRLAPRVPGFGVVIHTGRKSHRTYYTPVNVFPQPDGFVIALTYGSDSQWTRNVLENGGCKLITRGKVWRLTNPRLYHDERRLIAPGPVRMILGLLNVADFLKLSLEDRAKTADPVAAA